MVLDCELRDEKCFVPGVGNHNKCRAGLGGEGDTNEGLGLTIVNEPLKPQHQLHQLYCLGA